MPGKLLNSFLLLAGMLIVCFSAFPQSAELDSLKALLKEASGNRKGHLLNEIGLRLTNEEALNYYEQAIAESTDSVLLARAFCNLGNIMEQAGRIEEAEKLLETAIPGFEKIPAAQKYTVRMYSVLGRINMFTGRYSTAMRLFHKELSMAEQENDSFAITGALIDLGLLHYKIRRNEKALELFGKGRDYCEGNKQALFCFYANSSLCLSELGQPPIGLEYCKVAFPYTEEKPTRLLHLEFATGFAELKLGCTGDAREMFTRSLGKSIELNDARMQADNLLYTGKAWLPMQCSIRLTIY